MTYSYKLFDDKCFPYRVCSKDFFNFVNEFCYFVFQIDDEFHFFKVFTDLKDPDIQHHESLGYINVCN